jgi:hypothetical protein
MSIIPIPLDPSGLEPRTIRALDDQHAAMATWSNRGVITITNAFTAQQPRCRYALTVAQSIPDATATAISWSGPGHDLELVTGGLGSGAFDNGVTFSDRGPYLRVTGPYLTPPIAGQYLVIASVSWEGHATGVRTLTLQQRVAGGTPFDLAAVTQAAVDAVIKTQQVAAIVTVRDPALVPYEDAVRVLVYQNRGGVLNALAGYAATTISIMKVS